MTKPDAFDPTQALDGWRAPAPAPVDLQLRSMQPAARAQPTDTQIGLGKLIAEPVGFDPTQALDGWRAPAPAPVDLHLRVLQRADVDDAKMARLKARGYQMVDVEDVEVAEVRRAPAAARRAAAPEMAPLDDVIDMPAPAEEPKVVEAAASDAVSATPVPDAQAVEPEMGSAPLANELAAPAADDPVQVVAEAAVSPLDEPEMGAVVEAVDPQQVVDEPVRAVDAAPLVEPDIEPVVVPLGAAPEPAVEAVLDAPIAPPEDELTALIAAEALQVVDDEPVSPVSEADVPLAGAFEAEPVAVESVVDEAAAHVLADMATQAVEVVEVTPSVEPELEPAVPEAPMAPQVAADVAHVVEVSSLFDAPAIEVFIEPIRLSDGKPEPAVEAPVAAEESADSVEEPTLVATAEPASPEVAAEPIVERSEAAEVSPEPVAAEPTEGDGYLAAVAEPELPAQIVDAPVEPEPLVESVESIEAVPLLDAVEQEAHEIGMPPPGADSAEPPPSSVATEPTFDEPAAPPPEPQPVVAVVPEPAELLQPESKPAPLVEPTPPVEPPTSRRPEGIRPHDLPDVARAPAHFDMPELNFPASPPAVTPDLSQLFKGIDVPAAQPQPRAAVDLQRLMKSIEVPAAPSPVAAEAPALDIPVPASPAAAYPRLLSQWQSSAWTGRARCVSVASTEVLQSADGMRVEQHAPQWLCALWPPQPGGESQPAGGPELVAVVGAISATEALVQLLGELPVDANLWAADGDGDWRLAAGLVLQCQHAGLRPAQAQALRDLASTERPTDDGYVLQGRVVRRRS